jgi:ArsR family transcriptional regulator, arsenate/arsenite/antimonite-responsive transcriptional repressor
MRIRKSLDESNEDIIFLSKVSDAVSHPVRMAILKYVSEKTNVRNDVCNNDLVNNFPYAQATISQHVKKMVDAGLFEIRKSDKFTLYSINRFTWKKYLTLLKEI